jgi:thiol:disulfide interchange protein DsbD
MGDNGGFLEPEKAFVTEVKQKPDTINFNIKLDKTIYLYDDKIKVSVNGEDITKKVFTKKPVEYDGFIVHFDGFDINVPKSMIKDIVKSGEYEVKFEFQGCSKAGLCYTPMEKSFKGKIAKAKKTFAAPPPLPDFGGNGGFLEPEKAFVSKVEEKAESIDFSVKLDKTIYLYDDKIKVSINGTNITKKVFTKKPIEYDGFIVHFKGVDISVPKTMIKEVVGSGDYEVKFNFQGCSKAGLCYTPMEKSFKGTISGATTVKAKETTPAKTETTSTKAETSAPVNETDSIAGLLSGGNIFIILATFFGFGLLLSLTPCIFPMIPILSSIIVQHSQDNGGEMSAKKGFFLSVVYVLSMAAAYTIAGVLAGLFGANIQAMLQNPYVLVGFALVFVALAFSLFGYYSLELPQSFQNKINQLSGDGEKKGGIVGVAIMGFLSALIVGPCVAPPLAGALLYIGQTGDALLGGLALFVMSIGLGAPLLLIGLGAGKYMPKPGGWMETVSKVFGIVMLALAIYMLDRILDPTIMMYLWAVLFIGAGLYLQEFKHIIARTITAVILVFGVILFVGAVSGATNPLKPLSAFTSGGGGAAAQTPALQFKKVKNIAELEAAIKASDKPVMLDFWAEWCVSCKELDNFTFTDPAVIEELSKYTLLKADVTKNNADDKALMKKFNVFGPPALIFWDKDGKREASKRIVGYKAPKDFLAIITK